jgi:hypothetical protein
VNVVGFVSEIEPVPPDDLPAEEGVAVNVMLEAGKTPILHARVKSPASSITIIVF